MAFDSVEYNNQYKRDKYDRISLLVPKGGKQILQDEARIRGIKSVNELVIRALEKTYHITLDNSKPDVSITEDKADEYLLFSTKSFVEDNIDAITALVGKLYDLESATANEKQATKERLHDFKKAQLHLGLAKIFSESLDNLVSTIEESIDKTTTASSKTTTVK